MVFAHASTTLKLNTKSLDISKASITYGRF